jgi:acylphosphatase
MQQQTLSIQITGKVQGVWFRKHAAEKAQQLGITGYVTNRADGSVQIIATGTSQQLHALTEWCKKGPPLARVTAVSAHPLPLQQFPDFTILR